MLLSYCLLVLSAIAGTLSVHILDIGQGDSILIQSPEGKVVLIDGGTGSVNLVPYLQSLNVEEVNLMVATHAHADHIGGLDDVINAFPVKVYLDNGQPHTTRTYNSLMKLVEDKNLTYISAKNGRVFNLGSEVTLEVLHPQDRLLRNTRSDLNSNSVVIRMRHGQNCFLFTGDAEEPTEHILVQKGIEPCNVLKVAHHGSNHSSSQRFLQAVQPDIALISMGVDNRYNHPGEETIQRLKSVGSTIYRTDQQGTITLESDGTSIAVSVAGKSPEVFKPTVKTPVTAEPEPTATQSDTTKFNLNTANAAQLQSIPGMGPKRSNAILEYRNQHGPFSSLADLQKVSGIGPKTAATISLYAYIE